MQPLTPDQQDALNIGTSRFAAVFERSRCPRPLYDQILLEIEGCVITPTLGSIVPYWLLIIPRQPLANFAQWRLATGLEPYHLVHRILAERGISQDRALWFEHGAAQYGSPLSCGVDHAHLHLIIDAPFSFQKFISAAIAASDVTWNEQAVDGAYGKIGVEDSYLFAACSDRSVFSERVDFVGSQFFRRVVARLTSQPTSWNYKTHCHLENVQKTIQEFAR